jgi:hypothetical protein
VKRGAYIFGLELLLVIPVQRTVAKDLAIWEHQLQVIFRDDGGPNRRGQRGRLTHKEREKKKVKRRT